MRLKTSNEWPLTQNWTVIPAKSGEFLKKSKETLRWLQLSNTTVTGSEVKHTRNVTPEARPLMVGNLS